MQRLYKMLDLFQTNALSVKCNTASCTAIYCITFYCWIITVPSCINFHKGPSTTLHARRINYFFFPVFQKQYSLKSIAGKKNNQVPGTETYTSRFLLTGYVGLIWRSTAVATARQSTVESTMRVLCSYWMRSSFCHSSVRVPSKVLQLAVATAVLRYMRPMKPVRGIWMCKYWTILEHFMYQSWTILVTGM